MMKKIKFLMMGLLFVGVTGLTSCKKEIKIERNLWNKGGEWNITKIEYEELFLGDKTTDILYNPGIYKFEKDGSGKVSLYDEGTTDVNDFKYKNTESTLLLTYKQGPFFDEGDKIGFNLTWEKDKITLNYKQNDGVGGYEKSTWHLEKK